MGFCHFLFIFFCWCTHNFLVIPGTTQQNLMHFTSIKHPNFFHIQITAMTEQLFFMDMDSPKITFEKALKQLWMHTLSEEITTLSLLNGRNIQAVIITLKLFQMLEMLVMKLEGSCGKWRKLDLIWIIFSFWGETRFSSQNGIVHKWRPSKMELMDFRLRNFQL